MDVVRRDGESKGAILKGKKEIKFTLDIKAREILRRTDSFTGNDGYMLAIISPMEMQFKKPPTLEDFYGEVLIYDNIELCEREDIYLAARNGLKIETELLNGFVSLAMQPLLCMDKKWRILSLHFNFQNCAIIEGQTCRHLIETNRKFIFRLYPKEG